MSLRRQAIVQLCAFLAFMALLFELALLTRDVYAAPGLPALWLTVAGAVAMAPVCLGLLRGLRRPLENPLSHMLGSLATGAIAGAMLVHLATNMVVRMTANEPHAEWTGYVVTTGWKNCRFGVAFDDPVLRGRIQVCGPRWGLPATPGGGVLHVVEVAGPYGVVLRQVTT